MNTIFDSSIDVSNWGGWEWTFVVVIGLVLISGFILNIYYLKLSWLNRNNSRNENGAEFAQSVLKENLNSEIEVKPGKIRLRYVNYRAGSKKLKTGFQVSRRKSIWTLADATRQAFAADIIERNANGEKAECKSWVFKIMAPFPQLLLSFLSFFSIIGFAYALIEGMWLFTLVAGSLMVLILIAYSYANWKAASVMNKHSEKILGELLTEKETKQIKTLFKIQAIAALLTLLLNILQLLYTIAKSSEKSKDAKNR